MGFVEHLGHYQLYYSYIVTSKTLPHTEIFYYLGAFRNVKVSLHSTY